MTWLNRFRLLPSKDGSGLAREIADEFTCNCEPGSRSHEMMVLGALRNMNHAEFYLEDGVPQE